MDSPDEGLKPIMSDLLHCSHELLHNIFALVEPADLASLAISCRTLANFIRGNALLHKEVYLQRWDAPLRGDTIYDWQASLRQLVRLEKVLESRDNEVKHASIDLAARAIEPLLLAPHADKNIQFLQRHFSDPNNVDSILACSSIYKHGGTAYQHSAAEPRHQQLAAKLHVYFGIPIDNPSIETSSCPHNPSHRNHTQNFRSPYHILYPRGDNSAGDLDSQGPQRITRSQIRVRYPANNVARARVYDLSKYTMASLWGPFKNDGSKQVDWEKMESIMVLLGYNLRLFAERDGRNTSPLWYGPWEGISPGSFPSAHEDHPDTSLSPPPEDLSETARSAIRAQHELDVADPYGVSGTWMRVVCFLDYNDLYAFNFTNLRRSEDQAHGISTREAIRLIRLKIRVTKIVYPSSRRDADDSDSSSDFGDDEPAPAARDSPQSTCCPSKPGKSTSHTHSSASTSATAYDTADFSAWPVVYFTGTSHSMHASWDPNANSRIRGVVRMTKHGDVRWTTWSIFHGEERWRSEGVQVGGPKSRRGVLGNWFDKDYEQHGPAGPTAFWKVSNDAAEEDPDAEILAQHGLPPFLWHWNNDDSDSDPEDNDDEEDDEDGDDHNDVHNDNHDDNHNDHVSDDEIREHERRDPHGALGRPRRGDTDNDDNDNPRGRGNVLRGEEEEVEIIDEERDGVEIEWMPLDGEEEEHVLDQEAEGLEER